MPAETLDARIADTERRLRFAENEQTRRAASAELDDLNSIKLAEAQRHAASTETARLAELGIAPTPEGV